MAERTIPQRELRTNIGAILRVAEAPERAISLVTPPGTARACS